MRILYIGCVNSSYIFLEELIEVGAEIVGVITKASSKFNSDFTDLVPLCRTNGIPYTYSDKNRNVEFIKKYHPDIGFVFGWSELISKEIIDLFPKGMVGYHPAKLPMNRGRHPIIWALALGLKETASSFFYLEETADSGDILSQVDVDIDYYDNAETLMNKVLCAGKRQVIEIWRNLELGTIKTISQDYVNSNSWRKRCYDDGKIDWRMSSYSIYNLVRALTRPYVGAHFLKDGKVVKVWKVREIVTSEYINIEPGKVIDVSSDDDKFIVKAGDNLVEVVDYSSVNINKGEYLL